MKKMMAIMAAGMLASGAAQAAQVTGQITFTGGAAYYDAGDGGSTIDGIDMGNNGIGTAGSMTVGPANFGTNGDFVAVAGMNGTINDVVFTNASVTPLWSVGGFTFDLLSYTHGPTGPGYEIVGTGVIKHASFDDTVGRFAWNTSANSARFLFDAVTNAPEPAALALMGLGLLGLGFAKRKSA